MIRLWNTLPDDIRLKNNYPDFLEEMHKKYSIHFHYDTEIDNIYMKLRFQSSTLNADQFKFNFVQSSKCLQCNKNKQETIHHYFMDCDEFKIQRQLFKKNISKLHEKFQKLTNRQLIQIIQGHKDTEIESKTYKNVYQYVKCYIVTTGRFAA